MNTKVKELAEQAWEYASQNSKHDPDHRYLYRDKFAELMIAETISLFDGSHAMMHSGIMLNKNIINQIKSHFEMP